MSKEHDRKTNAMRVLDAAGTPYEARFFDCPEAVSGVEVARILGLDPDTVFKTLVTRGKSGEHLRVHDPRSLRAGSQEGGKRRERKSRGDDPLARAAALDRLRTRGCSPLGMKKAFPTAIDETCQLHERIAFSGGRIGCQIEMTPDDLARAVPLAVADLTVV